MRLRSCLLPWALASTIAADTGACNVGSCANASVDWDRFESDGFIVFPGVLNVEQIARAKLAFRRSQEATNNVAQFRQEGSLIELDPVFGEFLESLPQEVERKMEEVLGPWIVGGYAQITLNPLPHQLRPRSAEDWQKRRADGLHSDFPYGHSGIGWGCRAIPGVKECLTKVPAQYPRTLQLIFMLDDFTETNGGTLILPGSHRDRELPNHNPQARGIFGALAQNAVGKAGDLVMYVGFMWHSSGVNVAETERAAVIIQCLPYFFKPMHGHSYTLPNRVAQTLSPKLRNRLGLTGYTWFRHTGQLGNGEPKPLRHGALMLWDALCYGYPTRQTARFYAWAGLLAPMVCCLRCRFLEMAKLMLAVAFGLLLGASMMREKFMV